MSLLALKDDFPQIGSLFLDTKRQASSGVFCKWSCSRSQCCSPSVDASVAACKSSEVTSGNDDNSTPCNYEQVPSSLRNAAITLPGSLSAG